MDFGLLLGGHSFAVDAERPLLSLRLTILSGPGRIAEDAGTLSFITRYCVSCRDSLVEGRSSAPKWHGGQSRSMEMVISLTDERETG